MGLSGNVYTVSYTNHANGTTKHWDKVFKSMIQAVAFAERQDGGLFGPLTSYQIIVVKRGK